MKRPAWVLAAALAACAGAAETPDDAAAWRAVDPENLLLIEVPYGTVAVELAPAFAPNHVARMKELARAGHYDADASFYRVIEGFVAQGGVAPAFETKEEEEAFDDGAPEIAAELSRPMGADVTFTPLGSPDLFAPETGHAGGFAAARDPEDATVWLAHCPGAIAMARGEGADTGSSHFYVVLGEPRYLDRNLTIFGRVIDGMDLIQKLNRGDRVIDNGVIPDPEKRDPILSMRVAADLPAETRPAFEVMRTDSEAFEAHKRSLRVRDAAFFVRKPPEVLDVCQVPAPVRAAE